PPSTVSCSASGWHPGCSLPGIRWCWPTSGRCQGRATGLVEAARLRHMDWSLLGCGANGHITFAPDQPELRERLSVSTREGVAWRCLRCGTFVVGEPTTSGPVSAAPRVRRAKELRSAFILRLFAVERFVRAIIFVLLAYAIWRFKSSQLT